MTQRYRFSVWCLAAVAMMTLYACSDTLSEAQPGIVDEGTPDGLAFATVVQEQADMQIALGGTKAAAAPEESNPVHPLEGGEGLSVHRLTLPFVGIHPGTVPAGSAAEAETKARVSDIVSTDYKTFHDTMAVWGYTDKSRTLFNNTLLKKVNGWRSSLRWPYDKERNEYVTSDDMLKPDYMRFYALSPSLEAMEMALKNSPSYTVKPQFEFTVPDNPAAQRDLLYGESDDIIIASIGRDANLGKDNKTVPLTFRHILTAVRFAQGNMPTDVTVRRITLSGIKNKGTYNPANYNSATDPVTSGWGSLGVSKSYSVYPMHDVTAYDSHVYIDNDSVLFLMPQTLAEGATMTVVLRKDGEAHDRTLTCSINGDVFQEGYTVTYVVTVGEMEDDYYLVVDLGDVGSEKSTPTDGATTSTDKYTQASGSVEHNSSAGGSITVHSFRNYKNYATDGSGTNRWYAVPWKVGGFAETKGGVYAYDNTAAGYVSDLQIGGVSIKSGTEQAGSSKTIDYTMTAQSAAYAGNHKTILAGNNAVSGMNLSTHLPDGTTTTGVAMTGYSSQTIYNTANCYIVNAKGSYVFPIVYGNAYQNGSVNINNGGGACVDHLGNPITSANILTQVNNIADVEENLTSELTSEEQLAGKTKKRVTSYSYGESGNDIQASLLWQDVNDLVTDVSISPQPTKYSVGNIGFTIGDAIQPGNAVIAFKAKKKTTVTTTIYDSSNNVVGTPVVETSMGDFEILWVWHIWVTDEVYPNAGEIDQYYPQYNSGSKIVQLEDYETPTTTYSILPVNLGWVPDDMAWNCYKPREVWVKLQQTEPAEGAQEAYIRLRKEAVPQSVSGTSTLYQWGRPTAFPMLQNPKKTVRNVYDISGATVTSGFTVKDAESAKSMVLNPMNMLRSGIYGSWWKAATDPAFWSSAKTLYDPCPPGYQMPSVDIFRVFSLTGLNSTSEADLNMWPSTASGTRYYVANKGGYMYAKKHTSTPGVSERYHDLVYMPTHGLWSGAKDEGHSMSNNSANSDNMWNDPSLGYYWTYSISSRKGTILQLQPDMESGEVFFDKTKDTWDALPIRPMAVP